MFIFVTDMSCAAVMELVKSTPDDWLGDTLRHDVVYRTGNLYMP